MKSPLCASEDVFSSMQSTPALASQAHSDCIHFAVHSDVTDSQNHTEDVWDIWPYCWVASSQEIVTEGFHSFHTKLNTWLLARHNRRVIKRHRAGLQGWNCEAGARLVK